MGNSVELMNGTACSSKKFAKYAEVGMVVRHCTITRNSAFSNKDNRKEYSLNSPTRIKKTEFCAV